MKIFLIDKGKTYTYEDLLMQVNNSSEYIPLFRTHSLYDFFCNLIIALISDNSLTLLDSDINPSEVKEIEEKDINIKRAIKKDKFVCIEELVSKLIYSTSEITIFTSGTTGQPKKVIHSIKTLTRSVRMAEHYRDQIWGYAYNPTHMAGLQVFFQAFENTNTIVNVFNHIRNEVYELIHKNQITHISATPTFYRLLLPVENEYLSVQRVTLGGEKSNEKLYSSILKIFPNAKINNIYASTEAGSLFSANGEFFSIPEIFFDKMKVIDGELLIHKSLLGKSDGFEYSDDYYHTGDLIEWIDQENRKFRFKSRKNELINVGGYKINPDEVENVLLQITGVQQAVVYGKANSVLGNVLCAEIKMETDNCLTEIDIRKYLSDKIQDFKIPRRIKFVESFSLTRTGKIKRT